LTFGRITILHRRHVACIPIPLWTGAAPARDQSRHLISEISIVVTLTAFKSKSQHIVRCTFIFVLNSALYRDAETFGSRLAITLARSSLVATQAVLRASLARSTMP
jgi:hypothetical protein